MRVCVCVRSCWAAGSSEEHQGADGSYGAASVRVGAGEPSWRGPVPRGSWKLQDIYLDFYKFIYMYIYIYISITFIFLDGAKTYFFNCLLFYKLPPVFWKQTIKEEIVAVIKNNLDERENVRVGPPPPINAGKWLVTADVLRGRFHTLELICWFCFFCDSTCTRRCSCTRSASTRTLC